MKVKIKEELKNSIEAEKMMESLKEDENAEFYAQMAAQIASGRNEKFIILESNAEITFNRSENLDALIKVSAFSSYIGFYQIEVFLSDLWKADGSPEIDNEVRSNMNIRRFKEVR